jgi:hypothetical protein
MKKTYKKPTVEVIRIQTQGMIATSNPAPTLSGDNADINYDGDYDD